jgi:hypothetical protein
VTFAEHGWDPQAIAEAPAVTAAAVSQGVTSWAGQAHKVQAALQERRDRLGSQGRPPPAAHRMNGHAPPRTLHIDILPGI